MSRPRIREKASRLPETPGVYFMKDAKGRILYIGKARNLRARVAHYFQSDLEPKTRALMDQVAAIDVLETATEVDALLAEARLVKDTQPKYNVKLKDDKSFTVLGLTNFDDFPKVWTFRQTDDVDAERFGPFTGAQDLRDAIKVLQKIFKFATCRIEMRETDSRRRFFRPCLLHAIRRCSAPCADRISKADYEADIASLRTFLSGDRSALLEELRTRMKKAARAQQYERAADLRDQIKSLQALDRHALTAESLEGDITPIHPQEGLDGLAAALHLAAPPRTVEGVDIAHLSGEGTVGSLVCFVDGVPFKSGYRRYRIRSVKGVDDFASIREVVRRRFAAKNIGDHAPPDILLIDGGPGQISSAAAALEGRGPVLLSLAKEEETVYRWDGAARIVKLDRASPALRLLMYVRDEAHRFAQHYHHLLRRKAVLGTDAGSLEAGGR